MPEVGLSGALKMAANLRLVQRSETTQKPEVRNPGRKSDAAYGRSDHKYLTEAQVMALVKAADAGRYGNRDGCMILMTSPCEYPSLSTSVVPG
jgi:hypothetical protein